MMLQGLLIVLASSFVETRKLATTTTHHLYSTTSTSIRELNKVSLPVVVELVETLSQSVKKYYRTNSLF